MTQIGRRGEPPQFFDVVVRDTLRVALRGGLPFFLIAFLAVLVAPIAELALVPEAILEVLRDPEITPERLREALEREGAIGAALVAFVILPALAYCVSSVLLIQGAVDLREGRPVRFGEYLRPAAALTPTLFLLSVVIVVVCGVGLLAFILPGLYLYALFAAATPALIVERAGLGALGRSVELTEGYRWPVLGVTLAFFLTMTVLSIPATMPAAAGAPVWLAVAVQSAFNAAATALLAVLSAMIYLRLRRIREGAA